MRPYRTSIGVMALAVLLASPLPAQKLRGPNLANGLIWIAHNRPTPALDSSTAGILGDGSHDHRYTGMWIGLGLGAGVTALNVMFCADPDTGCEISRPLTYGPLMTFVLGVTGALIGAQIGRGAPPSPSKPGSHRRRPG